MQPNEAPVAVIGEPPVVDGRQVQLTGDGSSDPDGTVASYAWTFDDGNTSTEANPTHTYGADGTYTVELTVTDNQGLASDPVTIDVTVEDVPAEPLELALVGDLGTFRASTQGVLTTMQADAPDSAFFLGDLSYGNATEQQWCDYVATHLGTSIPVGLLAGNHEDNGDDGYINNFIDCMSNPTPGSVGTLAGEYGRQYYVDLPADNPKVRVIMVSPGLTFTDTEATNYAPGSASYNWTSDRIDEAKDAGLWTVVGAHMNCVGIGPSYECPMTAGFFELLLDKKVDVVTVGHEHVYSRSHQLTTTTGTTCETFQLETDDANCVADTDDSYVAGAGTVLATVGTGGIYNADGSARLIDTTDPEIPYYAKYGPVPGQDNLYGYLRLLIDGAGINAEFVPTGGVMEDSFTISR